MLGSLTCDFTEAPNRGRVEPLVLSSEVEAPVPLEVAVADRRAAATTEAKLMNSCSRRRRSPNLPFRRDWYRDCSAAVR
jgi:hypothetical protein